MTTSHTHLTGTSLRVSPTALRAICIYIAIACLLLGCTSNPTCYETGTPDSELRTIHIVQRGWHTGILVPAADWPNTQWKLLQDFSSAAFLEFGWGDERFYQAEKTTLGMVARAALWPTPSVIHVIGLNNTQRIEIQADEIVAVRVSAEGLRTMTAGIEFAFAGEQPTPNRSGAFGSDVAWAPGPNRFYEAKRPFYFPRMCNWWVARRLEAAGCPIRAWSVVTASRIIREARNFSQ